MKSVIRQVGVALVLTLLAAGFAGAAVENEEPKVSVDSKRCIRPSQIQELDVVDDQTILFRMRGNKVYRNRLPHKCPLMNIEDAISYETSRNRLCSVDMVRIPRSGLRCGLGVFELYDEKADAESTVGVDKEEI